MSAVLGASSEMFLCKLMSLGFFQSWLFALLNLNREWDEEKGKEAVVN